MALDTKAALSYLEVRAKLTAQPYKRYMVFGWSTYYPGGGTSDLEGSFDTLEEAREFGQKLTNSDDWEILDRIEGVMVT